MCERCGNSDDVDEGLSEETKNYINNSLHAANGLVMVAMLAASIVFALIVMFLSKGVLGLFLFVTFVVFTRVISMKVVSKVMGDGGIAALRFANDKSKSMVAKMASSGIDWNKIVSEIEEKPK